MPLIDIRQAFQLSETQKAANTTRSKVRARVEHVFGEASGGPAATTLVLAGRRNATSAPTIADKPVINAVIRDIVSSTQMTFKQRDMIYLIMLLFQLSGQATLSALLFGAA